jgi:hypothetical protein
VSHDDLVRFSVSCPICRTEVTAEYRRLDVVGALLNDRPVRLHAPCCDKTWTASYIEMQQIRACFDTTRLDEPSRNRLGDPHKALDD